MTMDDAVKNARQRREQLQHQEDEAAERMHAYLDAILGPLAALSPPKATKRRKNPGLGAARQIQANPSIRGASFPELTCPGRQSTD